ncbi:MAG: hypothetical protein RET84_02695 [Pseudomonadota bacterium]|nr:hypothetical protein [Pseudomonadota bacterium]MDQ8017147.1 hypothetical protein [Pseudomonadota bacterium]
MSRPCPPLAIRVGMARPRPGRTRGSAITEALLIASFAAITLAAIPAIANYGTKRMQAVSGARLLAWERNVWLPESPAIDDTEMKRGASGALKKTDAEVTRDLRRHIFRDRTLASSTVHANDMAEFTGGEARMDPNTVSMSAATTAAPMPALLNAGDVVADKVRVAQDALASNVITQSLGQFSFVSSGYLRNEVTVRQRSPRFSLVPELEMREQVTMLTEAWNAGGTNREEKKIQGLVLAKLLDSVFYQQFRGGFHQTGYAIKQIFPAFDVNKMLFGLTPGDAMERTPLDRFERAPTGTTETDGSGGNEDFCGPGAPVGGAKKGDCFRYYRAFPPTPVLNTLP